MNAENLIAEAGPDSALDLLVIEPEIENRRKGLVRPRVVLRGLEAAMDLVDAADAQPA